MEKVGLSGFETPVRNIYILPEDIYKKYVGKDTAGGFVWEDRIIFINGKYSKQNLLFYAKLIFHELLHLKQKTALEAQAESDKDGYWVTAYRGGLHVLSSQKARRADRGHQHFAGLNEAMVASQEKEFIEEALRLPFMKSEQDWLSSEEAKANMENMARERRVLIEDIVWADKEGKTFFTINYPRQREVLDYICEEIQKDNNNSYESKNEVADEFLQSFFSGKLLRIARLTESTFGEGSFRILGTMGKDEETPLHILDILRSMRNRKLKYGKNT
jgi:hypothetical protein